MKLPKRHGPTVFLLIMVFTMVVVMTVAMGYLNGAYDDGFLHVWPRQFAIGFAVALPAAFVARKLAATAVARLTE